MMTFEPYITGNILFIVLVGIVILWIIQLVFIWKDVTKRQVLKSILQTVLFAAITFFLLQPTWDKKQTENSFLLYQDGYSIADIKKIQDSLAIPLSGTITKLQKYNPNKIFLFGQDYSLTELMNLPNTALRWIPYYKQNQITSIFWDGVVVYGQVQKIKGNIYGSQDAIIQLLESGEVKAETISLGENGEFEFLVPALVLGQNELELKINGEFETMIRFFVNPATPFNYQLLFGFPNPEGRVLSEYLVERGDKAGILSQVSKEGRITLGESNAEKKPDVFIFDPSQIKDKLITEAFENGNTSLLILNLSDIEKDILQINQQFKTNFKLRKIGDELRETESGVMAAPYIFESGSNLDLSDDGTVAMAFVNGSKIAVSLLESTYQLVLAGDSLQYSGIWEKTLSAINPPQNEKIEVQMPVFSTLFSEVKLLSKANDLNYIQVGRDSLTLLKNPVNGFKYKASWSPQLEGWQVFADSVSIYSYGTAELRDFRQIVQMKAFLRDRRVEGHSTHSKELNKFPGIFWLLVLLTCFTLIWIEPRFP